MKKITTIILALSLVFALCGCEGLDKVRQVQLPELPDVDATPEPVETLEPVVAPVVSEAGRVTVNYKNVTEESFDPETGERRILIFSYDEMLFYIEGRSDVADAINEYVARINETYTTGNDYGVGSSVGKNDLLTLAEDNYRYAYENQMLDTNLEFSSHRSATVERADAIAISLLYFDNVYTGGEYPHTGYTAYVFDTENGQRVTLDMLTSDLDGVKALLAEKLTDLVKTPDYAESIDAEKLTEENSDEVLSSLLRDGSWYFDEQGMVIFTNDGEISPEGQGALIFTIPYSDLSSVLDAKWIPSEQNSDGEFSVIPLEDYEDGSIEIVDKLTIDPDGQQLCLVADGSIYDVQLSTVDYMDRFYVTERLWYCNNMSDCAVQIVTDIPDGMPNLMISYRTTQGETKNILISQSGLDGSFVLVDDNIEAVG